MSDNTAADAGTTTRANPRKVREGVVASAAMDKTIVVTVTDRVRHPLYGKTMQRSYLTYAFSLLGLPAISIPCGFTKARLPVGLQIVGKRRGEAAVLRAAAAFEAARPWAPHVPPIVARRS